MSDTYLTPQLTNAGLGLVIEAMNGGSITFTKFQLGDGTQTSASPTALDNPRLNIGISEIDDGEGHVVLTGSTNSSGINQGFYAKELGVFAKGDDNTEVLYAYRYSDSDIDYFPAAASGRTLELIMSVVVQIGNAENVTAILIEGEAYASKALFEAHVAASNPHGITTTKIGAAAASHEHGVDDITGVLPASKGGTGKTSLSALANALVDSYPLPVIGTYTGDGTQGREINLGFRPSAVLLNDEVANTCGDAYRFRGALAVGEYGVRSTHGAQSTATTWNSQYSVLMITDNGFKVNENQNYCVKANTRGIVYRYIAFK